jgi:hypothetical protein
MARRHRPAGRAGEIGQVAEADLEGDGADGPARVARVAQHPMGTPEPLAEYKLRERGVLVLEQHLDVVRCHPLACCNGDDRQVAAVEMLGNVGLDLAQAGGAYPATLGERRGVRLLGLSRSARLGLDVLIDVT